MTVETNHVAACGGVGRGRRDVDAHEFVLGACRVSVVIDVVLGREHVQQFFQDMERNLSRALVSATPFIATRESEALRTAKRV
jgi:hypothetical protein